MKFSFKLLVWTMIVMALGFGFSGFYFADYVFQATLEREMSQMLDDSSILRFAFETAALNVSAKYDVLQDTTAGQIASNLESGGHNARRMLRLSDEQRNVLYASNGLDIDNRLLDQTGPDAKPYRVVSRSSSYYIQTGTTANALDHVLYLETMKDVLEVFHECALGSSVYRQVTIAMLMCGTMIMHLIASSLIRPIRLLTRTTKRMASGDYHYRARRVSSDELGQLTIDFNQMANVLEDSINKLEDEIQSREGFVVAFAHELKTSLTFIIGYVGMLRLRKLDEEKGFVSANYIYTGGKRSEVMSLRLLGITIIRHGGTEFGAVSVEFLLLYLYDMYVLNKSMKIYFNYDEGAAWAERNLIKSVLMNLLDNACKAPEPKGLIEVYGKQLDEGYRFQIKDHGVGIPREEQREITKAFYMVDKSRSRSRNGAGLGLALCVEILLLHESRLEIESEPGKGTRMSFVLPVRVEEESV